MTTILRYAALAAVSTKSQATDDKVSLPEQINICRDRATRRGWLETSGPYIIAGQSRTRYVDLSKAESDIPILRQMLDDAKAGRFDVLVILEYNRLRDLLDMISTVLGNYNIQIFSATQPVEPMPVEEFRPYLASTQNIMQTMSQVISKRQADDLKIKYQSGMNGRTTRLGLPLHIPYGYRKPAGRESDRKAIPEQDPDQIKTIIHMKDMLLAGQSIRQISEWLAANYIPSPKGKPIWKPSIIRDMLINPFYAGTVRWGANRYTFDARTRRSTRHRYIPDDQIVMAPGVHQPAWDAATHQAILAELKRRGRSHRGYRTYQLTNILNCGICNAPVYVLNLGPENHTIHCSADRTHIRIPYTAALQLLIDTLAADIQNGIQDDPEKQTKVTALQSQITELTDQRTRLVDAYQAGLLEMAEYATRRKTLDADIKTLETQIREYSADTAAHAERQQIIEYFGQNIEEFQDYILNGESQEVNRTLRVIIARATIHSPAHLELTYH